MVGEGSLPPTEDTEAGANKSQGCSQVKGKQDTHWPLTQVHKLALLSGSWTTWKFLAVFQTRSDLDFEEGKEAGGGGLRGTGLYMCYCLVRSFAGRL